jgi:sugar (pentulose or hexulose) kinase
MKQNVIAIFDIGKTNKKLFLFDEQYKLVYEQSQNFEETKDEDGFPCEDVHTLSKMDSTRIPGYFFFGRF